MIKLFLFLYNYVLKFTLLGFIVFFSLFIFSQIGLLLVSLTISPFNNLFAIVIAFCNDFFFVFEKTSYFLTKFSIFWRGISACVLSPKKFTNTLISLLLSSLLLPNFTLEVCTIPGHQGNPLILAQTRSPFLNKLGETNP